MKFSINQSELQGALGVVAKGAATRSTLPILSGILLKAYDDSLTLESTNLDLSIQCSVAALIEEEGEAVIPSKLLNEVVKSLPDAAVHFSFSEDSVDIICDTASFSLKTLPAQDFPGFPSIQKELSVNIPFVTFSHMVKRVAHVVSKDESRAILTGVLIDVSHDTLKMVATDSYRLAVTETNFEYSGEDFNAVIAGSFLMDVASLTDLDDTLEISTANNQIIIKYQNMTFVNRKIEGNYPHYNQLIPDSYEVRACYDTKQLIAAVKRTSLLSNKTSPVKFDLNKESQTTQISTASQDVGTACETIKSDMEGSDAEIAFNFSYTLDGLSSVETDQVYLEMQSSMKPGIFKSDAQERYLYLIMPVRLS